MASSSHEIHVLLTVESAVINLFYYYYYYYHHC